MSPQKNLRIIFIGGKDQSMSPPDNPEPPAPLNFLNFVGHGKGAVRASGLEDLLEKAGEEKPDVIMVCDYELEGAHDIVSRLKSEGSVVADTPVLVMHPYARNSPDGEDNRPYMQGFVDSGAHIIDENVIVPSPDGSSWPRFPVALKYALDTLAEGGTLTPVITAEDSISRDIARDDDAGRGRG